MKCLKGKKVHGAKSGDYRCQACGILAAKKKRLCKPKKAKSPRE